MRELWAHECDRNISRSQCLPSEVLSQKFKDFSYKWYSLKGYGEQSWDARAPNIVARFRKNFLYHPWKYHEPLGIFHLRQYLLCFDSLYDRGLPLVHSVFSIFRWVNSRMHIHSYQGDLEWTCSSSWYWPISMRNQQQTHISRQKWCQSYYYKDCIHRNHIWRIGCEPRYCIFIIFICIGRHSYLIGMLQIRGSPQKITSPCVTYGKS